MGYGGDVGCCGISWTALVMLVRLETRSRSLAGRAFLGACVWGYYRQFLCQVHALHVAHLSLPDVDGGSRIARSPALDKGKGVALQKNTADRPPLWCYCNCAARNDFSGSGPAQCL